jgi:hypothetical protein
MLAKNTVTIQVSSSVKHLSLERFIFIHRIKADDMNYLHSCHIAVSVWFPLHSVQNAININFKPQKKHLKGHSKELCKNLQHLLCTLY